MAKRKEKTTAATSRKKRAVRTVKKKVPKKAPTRRRPSSRKKAKRHSPAREEAKPTPSLVIQAPATITESLDRDLAVSAIEKKRAGKSPTAREAAALKRVEDSRAAAERDRAYRHCPKIDYCRMSGRPTRTLHEQAERYGLPLRGDTINLNDLLKAFHDFLAKHAMLFAKHSDDVEEDRLLTRRSRVARVVKEEAEAQHAADLWISRKEAKARHLQLVRWFRAMMSQASVDLATKMQGVTGSDRIREVIGDYFLDVRRQATQGDNGRQSERRTTDGSIS